MALLHGKEANIYWDAARVGGRVELQHGQSWSLDGSHDVADITSMQDIWRTFIGGFRDWTATVECLLDSAGTDIPIDSASDPNGLMDVAAKLELYFLWHPVADPNKKYICLYGSAMCTGINPSVDKDGVPTVSYTFQGTDVIAWYSEAGAAVTPPTYA